MRDARRDAGRVTDPLAAVTRLAARLGLPADDPQVVSDRGNLLVRLASAPVLARVATATAWTRRDPAAWLAREVAVARYASERGGPVAAPWPDAGPHDADGFVVTLAEYRDVRPGRADGFVLGGHLGALHRATAGCTGLPWLAPATTQVTDALDAVAAAGALPADRIDGLRERHASCLAAVEGTGSAPVVLHGDAHPGNLRRAADGWFWVDLEETCAGPPEWDLAVAAGDGDPAGVLAGYAHATGHVLDAAALEPFRRLRDVEAAAWLAAMAHLRPERYAESATARVAQVTGRGPRRAAGSAWSGPSPGRCW